MPIHQVRHVGLSDAQDFGDFALFQRLVFEDFQDMESGLRARQKLVGVFEARIREDRSRNPLRTQLVFVSSFMHQLLCFGVAS